MRLQRQVQVILLAVVLLLSLIGSASLPPELLVRATRAAVNVTPTPTAAVQTPVPSPTPALNPTALAGSKQEITPNNAAQLSQLAAWGQGEAITVQWAAGRQVVLVQTPYGLHLYKANRMERFAYLEAVSRFLVAPDDQHLLAAYANSGVVKVWNASEGRLVRDLEHVLGRSQYEVMGATPETERGVRDMVFAPDGKTVAISFSDDQIGVWRFDNGELVALLKSNLAPPADLMGFSRDGKFLATVGSAQGSLTSLAFWQLSDGKLLNRIANAGMISRDPFSPDDRMVVTYSGTRVLVWSFPAGEILRSYGIGTADIRSVAFSADGRYLVVNEGEQVRRLENGTRLTKEQAAKVYTPPSAKPAPQLDRSLLERNGHFTGLQGILLLPDQTLTAWGEEAGRAFWWRVLTGETAAVELGGTAMSRMAAYSDGNLFAICAPKGLQSFQLFGKEAQTYAACRKSGPLVFSPVEKTLARGTSVLVNIISLPGGEVKHNLYGHSQVVTALGYSPDGSLLASGTGVTLRGAELIIWSTRPYALRRRITVWSLVDSQIKTLAFSPDNLYVVSGGADEFVKLWRVADGWQLKNLRVNGYATSITFSPDGRILAAGDANGEVHLWSAPDGKPLAVLKGGRQAVVSLAFSSDGRTLVTASRDGMIRQWGLP